MRTADMFRLFPSDVKHFTEDLLSRAGQFIVTGDARALILESLEPLDIENRDAAIADAHQSGGFETS